MFLCDFAGTGILQRVLRDKHGKKYFTVFAAAAVVGARDNFGISDQTAVVLRVETAVRCVIEHRALFYAHFLGFCMRR